MTGIVIALLFAGVVSQILSVVRLLKNVKEYSRRRFFYYLFNWYNVVKCCHPPCDEMKRCSRRIVKSFVLMLTGVSMGIFSYFIRNLTNGEWSSGEWVDTPAELAFCYFTGGVAFLFFFPIAVLFLRWFWQKCMD